MQGCKTCARTQEKHVPDRARFGGGGRDVYLESRQILGPKTERSYQIWNEDINCWV
jgi:hypothetical protein